jgi:hypothetical protein
MGGVAVLSLLVWVRGFGDAALFPGSDSSWKHAKYHCAFRGVARGIRGKVLPCDCGPVSGAPAPAMLRSLWRGAWGSQASGPQGFVAGVQGPIGGP